MTGSTNLRSRAVRQLAFTIAAFAAVIFLPAGTLRFWQGWIFLLLTAGLSVFFSFDLLKHSPELIARRLQRREPEPRQRLLQALIKFIFFSGFILAGLDFRFGWSRAWLGRFPLVLIVAGEVFMASGYWLAFWVTKTNRFAGSTVQVEQGQAVITTGPYAVVRHPMYAGIALVSLAAPLALGSYVALPVFALMVPVLAFRLIHEEEILCRQLPGYSEYRARTRFRLVPGVW